MSFINFAKTRNSWCDVFIGEIFMLSMLPQTHAAKAKGKESHHERCRRMLKFTLSWAEIPRVWFAPMKSYQFKPDITLTCSQIFSLHFRRKIKLIFLTLLYMNYISPCVYKFNVEGSSVWCLVLLESLISFLNTSIFRFFLLSNKNLRSWKNRHTLSYQFF